MDHNNYRKDGLSAMYGVDVNAEVELAESIMDGKEVLSESSEKNADHQLIAHHSSQMDHHFQRMMLSKSELEHKYHSDEYNKHKTSFDKLTGTKKTKSLKFRPVSDPHVGEPIHVADTNSGQYQIYHSHGSHDSVKHPVFFEPNDHEPMTPPRIHIGHAHSVEAAQDIARKHHGKHGT